MEIVSFEATNFYNTLFCVVHKCMLVQLLRKSLIPQGFEFEGNIAGETFLGLSKSIHKRVHNSPDTVITKTLSSSSSSCKPIL